MISTFCKTIIKAGSGGTQGTFSEVGDITVRNDTKQVRGLIAVCVADKLTTVEGVFSAVKLESDDWKYGSQYFVGGNSHGNGVATNEENFGVSGFYIPLDMDISGAGKVTISYCAYGVAVTENLDIAVGLLFANGRLPGIYETAISLGKVGPARGGRIEQKDNATISTVDFSTTGQDIPGWAEAIVGVAPFPVQDGVSVVDDPIIAKYVFHSTSEDFEPQEFPAVVGYSGGLGTSIVGTQGMPVWHIPTYIPVQKGTKSTLTANSALTVANAGNVAHIYNVLFR